LEKNEKMQKKKIKIKDKKKKRGMHCGLLL
jgi:hypothetical protein